MTPEPMKYKGYFGSAEINVEDDVLYGRLLFIKDVVTYEAETPQELIHAFRESVDDYLATCEEMGEKPDVPFKGTFNVRVGQDRHRESALAARRFGLSLNDFVVKAIDKALKPDNQTQSPVNIFVALSDTRMTHLTAGLMKQQQWESYVTTSPNYAGH